jgi:hypothetical protein
MSDSKDSWSDSDSYDENVGDATWVVIGFVSDRVMADFVINSLRSYEIPAVLNSKSGFFGTVGMTSVELPFSGGTGAYEILTIAEKAEEACDIAGMVGGDKWEPAGSVE